MLIETKNVRPVFTILGLVIAMEGGMSETAMMCQAKHVHLS